MEYVIGTQLIDFPNQAGLVPSKQAKAEPIKRKKGVGIKRRRNAKVANVDA